MGMHVRIKDFKIKKKEEKARRERLAASAASIVDFAAIAASKRASSMKGLSQSQTKGRLKVT